MNHFFEKEYDKVRRHIIKMSEEVECQLNRALDAYFKNDEPMAQKVIQEDKIVDRMEKETDEICVRLFAKLQPVAHDLRFLMAVIKMNNDLERIGDQAVSIARHVLYLLPRPRLGIDLKPLASLAKTMVHSATDAFVNSSPEQAHEVLRLEERMDALEIEMVADIVAVMKKDTKNVKRGISYLFIARALERAGDLATNVAEDIIFYIKAEDIRHVHAGPEVFEKGKELP